MSLSRNRSHIVAEAVANEDPLVVPNEKTAASRWTNEESDVELEKTGNDAREKSSAVIPWLQYAAKRLYTKKVAPDYAMHAYARKLAATSNASRFSGKVA